MSSELADSQLTEAIKANDQLAFRELFYKYYPKLFGYAVIHIRSSELASDLLQEVFFRIWEKREKLNPQKSIQAYLYKILNNLIINHFKLSSTKSVSIENGIKSEMLKTDSTQDSQIDLQLALDTLPPKLRIAFVLVKIEGFKYDEVAEICGISVKAVEKRIAKALKILKEFLI